MKRKEPIIALIVILIVLGIILFYQYSHISKTDLETDVITNKISDDLVSDIASNIEKITQSSEKKRDVLSKKSKIVATSSFGTLQVNDKYVGLIPGLEIHNSYTRLPPSRFYVELFEYGIDHTCFFDECGSAGAMVGSMGGWFEGHGFFESDELFEVKTEEDGTFLDGYGSIMVVANKQSIIVGLYLGATTHDIPEILRLHSDLADFGLLESIPEIGDVKVGHFLPELPELQESKLALFEDTPHRFSFYLVASRPSGSLGCGYYECGYYVEKPLWMGGLYYEITHEMPEIIDRLGLSTSQVRRGEVTLIILTDSKNRVLGIYPNLILRDIITILRQHPEVADFDMLKVEEWK